jgi:hypothetical protein
MGEQEPNWKSKGEVDALKQKVKRWKAKKVMQAL